MGIVWFSGAVCVLFMTINTWAQDGAYPALYGMLGITIAIRCGVFGSVKKVRARGKLIYVRDIRLNGAPADLIDPATEQCVDLRDIDVIDWLFVKCVRFYCAGEKIAELICTAPVELPCYGTADSITVA